MPKQSTRRPCPRCEGAGKFWHREGVYWPADGRDPPEPAITIGRCSYCYGSGEDPTVDEMRGRMISESP